MQESEFSCIKCGKLTCDTQNFPYPKECVTEKLGKDAVDDVIKTYLEDEENTKILKAAAEIEGNYYCKATRVEETVMFLKKIGAKKVGIASCVGMIKEAKTFSKILEVNKIETVGVVCKVGNRDKTVLNIKEEDKVHPGNYEPFCNPIMQAEFLNNENVDFVVLMGLCVGHDTLFFKYCKVPVTVRVYKRQGNRKLCRTTVIFNRRILQKAYETV